MIRASPWPAALAFLAGMADMVGPGTPDKYQVFAAPRP
jgi:hypothetical protein